MTPCHYCSQPHTRENACVRYRHELAKLERSCADCDAYAPVSKMIEKADGRVICPPCQKRVERITAERAQSSLFDSQLSMF